MPVILLLLDSMKVGNNIKTVCLALQTTSEATAVRKARGPDKCSIGEFVAICEHRVSLVLVIYSVNDLYENYTGPSTCGLWSLLCGQCLLYVVY